MSKKSKTILGWLLLIIVMSLVFAYLNHSKRSKEKIISLAVEDCAKNIPFSTSWQQKLATTDIKPDQNSILDFCHCTIAEVLANIPEEELQKLHQLETQARLERLGGQKAMEQKDADCFKEIVDSKH